jgi:hypothetical protein
MFTLKTVIGQPSQEEADSLDRELARRLFGDEVREPLIVNAELGIFPIEDDE